MNGKLKSLKFKGFSRKKKNNRTNTSMDKQQLSRKKTTVQKQFLQSENINAEVFDVVIVGGGAAGMSAALWCDELGLKTLLLEENEELGGQLRYVFNPIENHLGAKTKNGEALRKIFLKQIQTRRFTSRLQSKIVTINIRKKSIVLENGENIKWQFLIIATGVRRRKLGIEGEEKFKNRGIIESGKRDVKSAKNKKAAIIGGGDAALENALILAETAAKVTLVHRGENFRARPEFIERVKSHPKIEILTSTAAAEIIGDENVKAVKLKNIQTGKSQILPVETVLIRIGVAPNTEIFHGQIEMDQSGYIKVNQNCETNVPHIFAVGDVACPLAPTVSTAVGMGAIAAKVIMASLND